MAIERLQSFIQEMKKGLFKHQEMSDLVLYFEEFLELYNRQKVSMHPDEIKDLAEQMRQAQAKIAKTFETACMLYGIDPKDLVDGPDHFLFNREQNLSEAKEVPATSRGTKKLNRAMNQTMARI